MPDNQMLESLGQICKMVDNYFADSELFNKFALSEVKIGLRAYLERSGKKIRPALLIWSYLATGGKDISKILPIACGIESCHTWTLIHDDIIDCDDKRRGGDSIHIIGQKLALDEFSNISKESANKYGESYSILIGDTLHAISVSFMLEAIEKGADIFVVTAVTRLLEGNTLLKLIEGELLDVKFEHMKIEDITEDLIIKMMEGKTGYLIKFAAMAGAMLGQGISDTNDPKVLALGNFAQLSGIAFQLKDDVLGLIADEKKLGKPVGSDVLEGKKTLTAYYAMESFNCSEKRDFLSIYGNENASDEEVLRAISMIEKSGAIEKTENYAKSILNDALKEIDIIEPSEYKDLLIKWSEYMVSRNW